MCIWKQIRAVEIFRTLAALTSGECLKASTEYIKSAPRIIQNVGAEEGANLAPDAPTIANVNLRPFLAVV